MPGHGTHWKPANDADYDLLKGQDIISRDGQALGRISAVLHPEHSTTPGEGGHFFRFQPGALKSWFGDLDEAYLPESTIADVTEAGVLVDLTEEQIRQRRWDLPVDESGYQSR
jgi:hypothetical protein